LITCVITLKENSMLKITAVVNFAGKSVKR
jgi:hypothetical protein